MSEQHFKTVAEIMTKPQHLWTDEERGIVAAEQRLIDRWFFGGKGSRAASEEINEK